MRQSWLLLTLLVATCHALRVEVYDGPPFIAGTVASKFNLKLHLEDDESWNIYTNSPAQIEVVFPADKGFVIDKTELDPKIEITPGYEIAPDLNLDTPNEIRFVGGRSDRFSGTYVQVGCTKCFQLPALPLNVSSEVIDGIQVIMRKSDGFVAQMNTNLSITIQTAARLYSNPPSLTQDSTDAIEFSITPTVPQYSGSDLVIQLNDLLVADSATPSVQTNPDLGASTYDPIEHTLTIADIDLPLDSSSPISFTLNGLQVPIVSSFQLFVGFPTAGEYGLYGSITFNTLPKTATSGSIALDPPYVSTYSRVTLTFQPSVALTQGSYIKILFPNGYLSSFSSSESGALSIIAPSHSDISSVEKGGISDDNNWVKVNIGKDIPIDETITVTFEGVATNDNTFSGDLDQLYADAYNPGNVAINRISGGPALTLPPATNDASGLKITGFSASYSNKDTDQINSATLQFTLSYGLKKGSAIRLRFPQSADFKIEASASVSQFPKGQLDYSYLSGPDTWIGAELIDNLSRGSYTLGLNGFINPTSVTDLSSMYLEFLDSNDRVLATVSTTFTLTEASAPTFFPPGGDGGNAAGMVSVTGLVSLLSLVFAFLVAY